MKTFDVFGLCPADLAHPGLAVAVSRSGGCGLLDLTAVRDAGAARRNFDRLLHASTGAIGLRIDAEHAALAADLLTLAGARRLHLMIAGDAAAQRALRTRLGPGPQHVWLAEVGKADDAALLEAHVDALVARGMEAGGWVGGDSSFVLLQKLAGRVAKPLYAAGGIGLRAAAACRAAGAAGVVLDDALLLLDESPLPAALQNELARLDGGACRPLGELFDRACRVYAKPANALLKQSEAETRRAEAGELDVNLWTQKLQARLGWSEDALLPLGQAIGLSAIYRTHLGSAGRLVQAVRRCAQQQPMRAAAQNPLGAGSALAVSHGTRYPLVQGPMTRVSDSPAFAAEVAKAGALPFLALALMRGAQVRELLEQTRARLGDAPWGVGMLGFVPQALFEEQCAAIWAFAPPERPRYALIAGGRPDQAAAFESRGIPTYIHAPTPALLKLYLEQGVRRFVFEGRECGGHVGPIASFPLWEQMIELLLTAVPAGEEKNIHVLFAGGVHDALSGAMLAAMVAPLAERGMKLGALMGTAYLFTREIVASGAIVQTFQDEALRCTRTVNLESGPGHASRCVDTPFARTFFDERRRLLREQRSVEDIRDALEDLNLGRLRIAAKGLDRGADGKIVVVPEDRQRSDGMYMIGQVATLRDRVQTLAELHAEVCDGAAQRLEAQAGAAQARAAEARPSDVAIVGIGVTLPGANSPDDYWELILKQRSVLREAPRERWDPALFYDPDPKARDKVYSKWGGFLDEVPFDPLKFGIPPKSMKAIDPLQLLTLETAVRTLADAGYADGGFDRERASVILGAGGGAGDLGQQYAMRAELPRFVENLSPEVWERLPEWTEESFAGTLLNVAAGRIANRLDFGGVNYTVDAACGSSLAAISLAVYELETGRSDLVLAGGFDTTQSAFAFMAFAKTQALSPSGRPRTFDQAADGIAISEGVAMVALKRLADAERDGDRIYAVIKAAAGSSDGRALGLTAPRTEGQVRALERAYAKAGFSPATLDLIEAHGTGTPVGDRTEAQTVARALTDGGAAPKTAAIGSVKTILGHTKAAAGAAGLIKVALALYHRTLPGHYGVEKPIDVLADPQAPIYLLKHARAWLTPGAHPRRAAVSAFGFGGTNFHAVLEEYAGAGGSAGGARWPCELFLWRATDTAQLQHELERVRDAIPAGSPLQPGVLALALARQADLKRGRPVALAIVAADLDALKQDIARVLAHLQGDAKALPPHIRLNRETPADSPAVGFLFPGQGAQYVDMCRETALHVDELRSAVELAEASLREVLPERLSARIWPPAAFDAETENQQNAAITDTRYAQPAIGALSLGYLGLAQRLGLSAVATGGHSYGEYSALMASGAIDPIDFLRLSAIRGAAMAEAARQTEAGGMAAVQAPRAKIEALIANLDGVVIANHNAPEQSVISGPKAQIERAVTRLGEAGVRTVPLPVSGAFHTALMAPAQPPLSRAIHATRFCAPALAVFANRDGQPYPREPQAVQQQLDAHLLQPVEFVAQIEAMYAAGVRVFLELGPRGICAALVRQILAGRDDARAVSLDSGMQGMKSLQLGLAELFVAGVRFDAAALHAGRGLPLIEPAALAQHAAQPTYARHIWWLSGGCARGPDESERRTGKLPALTKAARDAARAKLETQIPPPAAPAAAPSPTAGTSNGLSNEALLAYQQTMRQFLALQERVLQQFLGGAAPVPAANPVMPTLPAAPAQPPGAAVPAPSEHQRVEPQQHGGPTRPAQATSHVSPLTSHDSRLSSSDAVDFKSTLLTLVAERTGYPTEMLDLDADLEADLGIDSIKRVEIIGALQKALPEAIAAGIKSHMARYTKARTLKAVLAELATLEAAAAPAQADATSHVSQLTSHGSVDFKSTLLTLVAERTGYPTEMLDLDADLEADLGIDSIKRVEIIGALQKALPEAIAAGIKSHMARYTKARTLKAVLAELATLEAAAAPAPAQTTSHDSRLTSHDSLSVSGDRGDAVPLPRYVVKSRAAPLAGNPVDLSGLALLLGADDAIRDGLARTLRARGLTPVGIDATDADALRNAIDAARARHGPVRALLHLHGLGAAAADDIDAWRALYRRDLLSLFHALQHCHDELAGARVLAASRLGGTFGRDAIGDGGPLAGGACGLLNCLRIEQPDCRARAVDFDGHTDDEVVELLAAELFADDAETEAGYIGRERYGAATLAQPLTATPFAAGLSPRSDWVVLASGGARGITAQIIATMARPGMHLVLLGRTPEPAAEAESTARHADADALRKALLAERLARGERPRPVEIEADVSRILVERELRANLARLRATGATVDYRAVDARDADAFGALIDELYARHGRIDAVLHAAGVIEDKLIKDKRADSFERVLATKLDPAFVLARRLRPESLKLIAFFTSVAGRYGNRGQADYAAANEALNRLAWELQRRWTQTRVIAVNWGPWEAGMANAAIQAQLRERGMEPIGIAAGCRFFLDELASGPRHEVELVAGRGPWGQMQPPAATAQTAAPRHAFVRKPARIGVGGAVALDLHLTLAEDPWLRDHLIDGQPVVPLGVALETMAQFVAQNWPGWCVAEVQDLQMRAPLHIDPEHGSDIVLRAKAATHAQADGQVITVQLGGARRGEDPYFRANVVLRQTPPAAAAPQLAALAERDPMDAADAYARVLCRGERLRVIERIDALAANGAAGRVRASNAARFVTACDAPWLFDPALLDALTQLAFVWAHRQRGHGVLPLRVGRVRRYGDAPTGRVALVQHLVALSDERLRVDAEFTDAQGVLRYAVDDFVHTMNAALSRLAPSSPDYVRPGLGQRG
ncbi:SDR family NAD(P)-dependent oxidoreductase [Sinimarinibacterium thermocellulolyticum]|uniref:SDR family NAD(P)-dependent oxidoreductase n=1 Tax=Sinimarinibacterium thermocellulolyticum TaxID=3170016 RepID=A0ABV2A682_9GAMM